MSTETAAQAPATVISHPRTLLLDFLGGFVRQTGGWVPVAALVSLMDEVGLDESSVRTAVSRLKQREWLTPDKRGGANGYTLSSLAVESYQQGDDVIWHARRPADIAEGWLLISVSIPESDRSRRHVLRSRLSALGFGNIGSGLWIAPARMQQKATSTLAQLELLEAADIFIAHYPDEKRLRDLVARGWDFAELDAGYRAFLADRSPIALQRTAAATDESDFVQYMLALNQWRVLPLIDPGLPRELLGDDWAGDAAGSLFENIVALTEAGALRHVKQKISA